MHYWTNKHWGALIGAAVVISAGVVGVGVTAIAILFGLLGYLIGRFLDGELNLQDVQDRAQGRTRYPNQDQGPARPPRVD